MDINMLMGFHPSITHLTLGEAQIGSAAASIDTIKSATEPFGYNPTRFWYLFLL